MKAKSNLKLKKNAKVSGYSATERLLDETFIAQAVWECLKNNDPQGVIEIIETHLEVVNKAEDQKRGTRAFEWISSVNRCSIEKKICIHNWFCEK